MRYEGTFPAVPVAIGGIRRALSAVARDCGLAEAEVQAVVLAVSEAATNAVVHGSKGKDGTIRIEAEAAEGELTVVVADDGGGLVPRTNSPGLGLGLPIIANVARRFAIENHDGGTKVQLVFPCRPR